MFPSVVWLLTFGLAAKGAVHQVSCVMVGLTTLPDVPNRGYLALTRLFFAGHAYVGRPVGLGLFRPDSRLSVR